MFGLEGINERKFGWCLPDDLGDVAVDVNYLDVGDAIPDFQIFICWCFFKGIQRLVCLGMILCKTTNRLVIQFCSVIYLLCSCFPDNKLSMFFSTLVEIITSLG